MYEFMQDISDLVLYRPQVTGAIVGSSIGVLRGFLDGKKGYSFLDSYFEEDKTFSVQSNQKQRIPSVFFDFVLPSAIAFASYSAMEHYTYLGLHNNNLMNMFCAAGSYVASRQFFSMFIKEKERQKKLKNLKGE